MMLKLKNETGRKRQLNLRCNLARVWHYFYSDVNYSLGNRCHAFPRRQQLFLPPAAGTAQAPALGDSPAEGPWSSPHGTRSPHGHQMCPPDCRHRKNQPPEGLEPPGGLAALGSEPPVVFAG